MRFESELRLFFRFVYFISLSDGAFHFVKYSDLLNVLVPVLPAFLNDMFYNGL